MTFLIALCLVCFLKTRFASRANNWWDGLEEMGTAGRGAPGVSEKGSAAVQLPSTTSNTVARCCARP